MQILYTYTKLYPTKSKVEEHAPKPHLVHLDPTDSRYKPTTWVQTGQFVVCGEVIVFQWRGTFDHEQEAERKLGKERIAKFKAIGKENAEWKDEIAFWDDWQTRMGEHNKTIETEEYLTPKDESEGPPPPDSYGCTCIRCRRL
jgi:hypothetical protein